METNQKQFRPISDILKDILVIIRGNNLQEKAGVHHNTLTEIKLKKSMPRADKLKKISEGLKIVREQLNKLIDEYDKSIEVYDKLREG